MPQRWAAPTPANWRGVDDRKAEAQRLEQALDFGALGLEVGELLLRAFEDGRLGQAGKRPQETQIPVRPRQTFASLPDRLDTAIETLMAGSIRFLLALGAIGGEATGAVAHTLWHKFSTTGRRAEAYRCLQASGQIDIIGSGPLDERIVRLTAKASLACRANLDPERLWTRPWDGTWRIVAFDIPETDSKIRAQLRRKLHELRFGWLQNSVWISPDPTDDFRALLSEKRLRPESLTLLEARPAGGESNESMVAAAWDFAALDKGHAQYLEILRLCPNRLQKPDAWLAWLETEHRAWAHLAQRDPFLPRILLPRFYRGLAVWAARQEAHAAFRDAMR